MAPGTEPEDTSPFKFSKESKYDYIWQDGTMTRWRHNYWVNGVYDKRILADYPLSEDSQPFRLYDLPPELRVRIFGFFCLANYEDYIEGEKNSLTRCEEDFAIASDAKIRCGWEHYFAELLPCRLVSRQFYHEFSETRAKTFTYEMPEFNLVEKKFQDTGHIATKVMEELRKFYRLIPEIERPNLKSAYIKCICSSNTSDAGKIVRETDVKGISESLEKIEGMHKDFELTVIAQVSKRWASKKKAGGVKKLMTFKPADPGWTCEKNGPVMLSGITMKKWKVEGA